METSDAGGSLEEIEKLKNQLLTKKEKLGEEFLKEFMSEFEKVYDTAQGTSADQSHQQRIDSVQEKLSDCSLILAHKFTPIVRDYIAQTEQKILNSKYGVIKATSRLEEDLSRNYKRCFNAFIDNEECVSFKAPNKTLLKNIDIKDAFLLTYYSMATNKRQQGDNLLQLIVCGTGSTGKSTIFESPLQEVAHNLSNDEGCGRFMTNSKSTLLLHDCDLHILVKGKDMDKLKAVTRGETMVAKVFGKTQTISNLFVIATSNKHLMNHSFKTPEQTKRTFNTSYRSDIKESKFIHPMDIEAVQNRFIELFVRQRPTMPPGALPNSGNFTRSNLIIGLYTQIIVTLCKYCKTDFNSEYLYLYPITGLCKNLWLMKPARQSSLRRAIKTLMDNYEFDPDQKKICNEYMDYTSPELAAFLPPLL
jgi:hypothetical protein